MTHYKNLLNANLIKVCKGKIKIDWLDKQLKERVEAHNKRVEAGRLGGCKAQAKLKQSSSKAQALRKDKKRKDNYANDNVLSVSDDIKKLLKK